MTFQTCTEFLVNNNTDDVLNLKAKLSKLVPIEIYYIDLFFFPPNSGKSS